MRSLLPVLALLLLSALPAAPLAAQAATDTAATPDSLSRPEMQQRAGYAAARAENAAREIDAALDHLDVLLGGYQPARVRVVIPANSGWAWIEVRRPGQPATRDSIWVRPKP